MQTPAGSSLLQRLKSYLRSIKTQLYMDAITHVGIYRWCLEHLRDANADMFQSMVVTTLQHWNDNEIAWMKLVTHDQVVCNTIRVSKLVTEIVSISVTVQCSGTLFMQEIYAVYEPTWRGSKGDQQFPTNWNFLSILIHGWILHFQIN